MCYPTSVRAAARQLFICVLLLPLALLPTRRLYAEMVDRVVAVVNSDVITLSELEKEGEGAFRQIAASTPAANLEARLAAARADILETLIDKHLITQKAAEKKITVSDAEVQAAFDNVLQRTRMSREQLLAKLEESGLDETVYRSTLKTQILQNKLVGADVTSKIIITDDMILDYYDTHYVSRTPVEKNGADGNYYLLQIGCSWQNGDKSEARKRAEHAHDLATSGKDFGEVARQFSDLPSRTDGGDIGSFELGDMAADMRSAVANLKVGEVSEIIETPMGFQFFKLVSGPGGTTLVAETPLAEAKEAIKQELYEQEMKKAYSQWVKELKSQAYIQKL